MSNISWSRAVTIEQPSQPASHLITYHGHQSKANIAKGILRERAYTSVDRDVGLPINNAPSRKSNTPLILISSMLIGMNEG